MAAAPVIINDRDASWWERHQPLVHRQINRWHPADSIQNGNMHAGNVLYYSYGRSEHAKWRVEHIIIYP